MDDDRSLLADQGAEGSRGSQKRALFFVFDGGTGVGHLRRLCCIARQLQGSFACLIVTGHRAAAHWFVPDECEYIHIPSWDSLLAAKAAYWGRTPFIMLPEDEAIRLRKAMLSAIVDSFAPDVIFVDHLPLGANGELTDIIKDTPCLKYLVTRGIQNETENLQDLIFGGVAREYLESHYHKVLVACDRSVFDFTDQYALSPAVRAKCIHTGYVIDHIPPSVISRTREDRGLRDGDIWVVASAGGGQWGEQLLERSIQLASGTRNVAFDIVFGPRSALHRDWAGSHHRAHIRLHRGTAALPNLHAAADVVISSGGYNSLLETLQGNAKILCFPLRKDRRDEQYRHATALREFVDIEVSTDVDDLPALFRSGLASRRSGRGGDRRGELDCSGASVIEKIVGEDMCLIGSGASAVR